MPFQSILNILKEISAHEYELEILDYTGAIASSLLGGVARKAAEDLLEDAKSSQGYLASLRPRLYKVLLELSPLEAQEFLKQIKGTEFEKILSRNFSTGIPPLNNRSRY